MNVRQHLIPNGSGWRLSLYQSWDPSRLRRSLAPVLIVPGYGMNSFIFSYHPRGPSLEGCLAEAGFEVWRADLRAQGDSVSDGGGEDFGLADLAHDLGVVIRGVLERTASQADGLHLVGSSLGGTLMFLHAALEPRAPINSMVAIGSPVRWVKVHPLVRVLFASPTLAGWVRFSGSRKLAELLLPQVVRFAPWLISFYLNPKISDTSAARALVKTIEDPNRYVNREIARWIRQRDLVVRGVNLSQALSSLRQPLLCIVANGDGVVPRATAEFPFHGSGAELKRLMAADDSRASMAHADLFISNHSQERVFHPVANWLLEVEGRASPRELNRVGVGGAAS